MNILLDNYSYMYLPIIYHQIIFLFIEQIFWVANISNTLFNQKSPVRGESGFPGEDKKCKSDVGTCENYICDTLIQNKLTKHALAHSF